MVLRGPRGAVRADTLDELQDVLDRPWSPEEAADSGDEGETRRNETRRDRGGCYDGGPAPRARGESPRAGPPGGSRKFTKRRRR